ncbi:MAG: HYR domain-containing protein, partial [Bacteroidales bacterium]|nr:HYR domain-containing protein [Bacteroidales bacterium]
ALGTPTTSDNCGIASVVNNAPAAFPTGNTTVIWTVTDNSGLTATASQVVTVIDNQPPVIVAPANVSVNTDAGTCTATAAALGTHTPSDNCGIASVVNNAPGTFPTGNTTVTWTVTDNAGLTATASQLVTVVDNQLPVIVAPANVSVNTDPGSCNATGVLLGTPTTSDNCGIASVVNNAPAAFPTGNTTVTWTVTDNSGLTATATQVVTVTDKQPPVIVNCAVNRSQNADGNGESTVPDLTAEIVVTENCSYPLIITQSPPAGTTIAIGAIMVNILAEDAAGNSASCSTIITVVEDGAPIITTCAAERTLTMDAGCTVSLPDLTGEVIATDNGTIVSVTQIPEAGVLAGPGTTNVSILVTDDVGNSSVCTTKITVIDEIPPVITAPVGISRQTDMGSCTATGISLGTPLASDNCSVAGITNDAPASFPVGVTTVTWTVTDNAGLTATDVQTVTITDNQNPVIINCLEDMVVDASDYCGSTVFWTEPTAGDNCSFSLSSSHIPGDFFDVGTTVVIYTATDAAGNTDTCTFNVRVNPPPAVAISGETIVCNPSQELYSISPVEGAAYLWSVTGGIISGSATNSEVLIAWENDHAGTVAVSLTNELGCVANGVLNITKVQGSETSEIKSKDGVADVNTYISELCPGDTEVFFKVTGAEGSSFNWNVSGGSIVRDYRDSIIVNWGEVPGEYEISVQETSVNGCVGLTKRATVLITPVSVNLGSDVSICEGDLFRLTPAGDFESVIWPDGSTGIPYITATSGQISCIAYNAFGCSTTDEMILNVEPLPVVDLGPDTSLCENKILDAGPDGVNYNWSNGEISREIEIIPGQQEIYVEVQNDVGCIGRDTIRILECNVEIDFAGVPNAITPNADGKNDVWIVDLLSQFPDVEVEIYDRWGRLIYRSEKGYSTPWDGTGMNGKPVPAGSYSFVFILNDPDHANFTGFVSVIK